MKPCERFFFEREAPAPLAALRIVLPWVLLIAAGPRWFRARELFSSDGCPAPLWITYGNQWDFLIPSGTLAVMGYSLLVFCLITASLGWMTRASLTIAAVLYPWFACLDSISTMTKYSVIASHVLMLLALSDCGRLWSLDVWLGRVRPRRSSVWPRRLIQLLICFTYIGTAITKMQTPNFLTGDHLLFWSQTDANFPHPFGQWISLSPMLLVVASYATLAWEVMFPIYCWRGRPRLLMLGLGVLFHAGTFLMLGLTVFPLIMISTYLAFLDPQLVQHVMKRVNSLVQHSGLAEFFTSLRDGAKLPVPAFGTYGFTLAIGLIAVGSVEAEYRLDPYGKRASGGLPALEPLPEAVAEEILSEARDIEPIDRLHRFDMGTQLVAGCVAPHDLRFVPGETANLQFWFQPPHPDLLLEVIVKDDAGRPVRKLRHIAPREHTRIMLTLPIDGTLTPGLYSADVQIDDKVVASRQFVVADE